MNNKEQKKQKRKHLKYLEKEKKRKIITKHYRNADAEKFVNLIYHHRAQESEIEQMNDSFEKNWDDPNVLFDFAVAKN